MEKKSVLILGVVLLAILSIPSFFVIYRSNSTPGGVACTMEAKICPDGSAVGREGPNCQFAECPSVKVESVAKINQRIWNGKISITPLEVLEDSRCPLDVMCIQAGTVRLRAKLETSGLVEEKVLKLGESSVFYEVSVELTDVTPAPNSKKTINKSDYRFYFR